MDVAPGSVRAARFGPFQVDFRAGELHKHGVRIRLQDQPLQILGLLIEHPGEVVTREELRQRLWPGDTFVDFDHGLNNAINRLREALADSAEEPRYIETLPRRGYRFIGVVENVETLSASRAKLAVPGLPTEEGQVTARAGSRRMVVLVTGAAVVFALALWGITAWRGRVAGGAVAKSSPSVAVLPMQSLSGDPNQAYVADAFSDALTTELAQIGALRVTSRFSAMQARGKPLPVIARELKVNFVVEGTVRLEGERMWVNVQVIDAAQDRHIWAHQYERSVRDLQALPRIVAPDLARELRVPMTDREIQRLARVRPVNSEAFEYYWRGRLRYLREGHEDNQIAIEALEHAVAADPSFAEAYAALAVAYRIRAYSIERKGKQRPWEEKAFVALERARAFESELADIYLAEGVLLWSPANGFAHEKAIQVYRQALALNPNLAEARHQIANIYNHIGLFGRASVEVDRAVELDPLNQGARYRKGVNLLFQGKYEEALLAFDALRSQGVSFPTLWGFQSAYTLFQLDRKKEATQRIEEFLKKDPRDVGGVLTSMQALLAADAGDTRRAEAKIQEAIRIGAGYQHFHHTAYVIASAYARLNKPDLALKYMQQAADDGFPCYPLFEKDPGLNTIRGDAKFGEFLARQKKQWEYFRAKL